MSAEYTVFPNGTAYKAELEITDTEGYTFADMGFMGEDVPLTVGDVQLTRNNETAPFTWSRPWGAPSSISFEKGNYSVIFIAPLRDNNLNGAYKKPYNVTVILPEELRVDNLLLAGLSNGANVTRHADNTTTVEWKKAYMFDLRFYTRGQEDLLWFFLQFLGILVLILVVIPYALSRGGED